MKSAIYGLSLAMCLALVSAGATAQQGQQNRQQQERQLDQQRAKLQQDCRQLAQDMQQMNARMRQQQQQVQQLRKQMNESTGEAQIQAMTKIVDLLADQQEAMQRMHVTMMQRVMKHQREHTQLGQTEQERDIESCMAMQQMRKMQGEMKGERMHEGGTPRGPRPGEEDAPATQRGPGKQQTDTADRPRRGVPQ